jgi:hypothetical protein
LHQRITIRSENQLFDDGIFFPAFEGVEKMGESDLGRAGGGPLLSRGLSAVFTICSPKSKPEYEASLHILFFVLLLVFYIGFLLWECDHAVLWSNKIWQGSVLMV